jgi:hypothetical protein
MLRKATISAHGISGRRSLRPSEPRDEPRNGIGCRANVLQVQPLTPHRAVGLLRGWHRGARASEQVS